MYELIKLKAEGNPYDGITWDYKGRSQIYRIIISYEADKIYGLQFQYLGDEGSLVLSDPLGEMFDAPKLKVIKLDYPSEYITWVKVKKSSTGGIGWLAFKTNLGNLHGTFPPTTYLPSWCTSVLDEVNDINSTEFDLGDDNLFGGFYGTFGFVSANIRSFGIYVKPVSSMKTTPAFAKDIFLFRAGSSHLLPLITFLLVAIVFVYFLKFI